jgi:hypothetical protein
MRQSTWSTVNYMEESNVTVHLFVWAAIAFFFSICEMPEGFGKALTDWKWVVAGLHLLISMLLWGLIAGIQSNDYDDVVAGSDPVQYNKASTIIFDFVYIGVYVLLLFLFSVCIMQVLYWVHFKMYGDSVKNDVPDNVRKFTRRVLMFDSTLLMAIPSITVLVCNYHGWRDYTMVVFVVTVVSTIMTLALADDVLNVFWSRVVDKNSIIQHTQVHIGIMLLSVFSLIYLFTANLPETPPADLYFGTLHGTLFLIFIVAIVIAPAMFHEFSSKDALDILYLKESAELVYRTTIMTIMMSIFWKSNVGTIVA